MHKAPIDIQSFIAEIGKYYPVQKSMYPWDVTNNIVKLIMDKIQKLNEEYNVNQGIAIHKSAVIEQNVVLKAPVIVGPGCFIGSTAYLRGGVHLIEDVKIGPGSEIKSSMLFKGSAAAHFNFIGDSIIGSNVNFEAGSVIANHYNERSDKLISVVYLNKIIQTGTQKFGALVGDGTKIGANAVLSPGTTLERNTIIKRLELVEQIKS